MWFQFLIGSVLLLGLTEGLSPYFSTETEEIDSSEHGGPSGKSGTTCECGWANKKSTRIVGGKETEVNEYPFVVAIIDRMTWEQFCGGTILTERHVLTAAHCTFDFDPEGKDVSVAVGEHNLNERGESNVTKTYRVRTIYQHNDYDDYTMDNDISILFLERKITFDKYIGPACVPSFQTTNLDNQYVRVIGWGQVSNVGDGSPVLKKVDVRVVPLKRCGRIYRGVNPYMKDRICTHGQQKGPCMGDSGGPLVWVDPDTNKYTVVGVVSFGKVCGAKDPAVYTDVANFMPWIKNIIDKSSPSPICMKK